MASVATTRRLAAYEYRYREIAAQVADIGFIASGSLDPALHPLRHRACHADPPRRHGPYWQWTAKVNAKTIPRRITPTEADLYQEWIANDRHLRHLTTQMRDIAAMATALTLKTANSPSPKV